MRENGGERETENVREGEGGRGGASGRERGREGASEREGGMEGRREGGSLAFYEVQLIADFFESGSNRCGVKGNCIAIHRICARVIKQSAFPLVIKGPCFP